MTQQLDPKQVNGLSASMAKTAGLANIKTIGANLNLTADGTLNATGGGGGSATLYAGYGQNTDGAMTQKASTDLFVHTAPNGMNNLIENNKITEGYLPDYLLGQVLYGGDFVPNTAVATLSNNAKAKLGTSSDTIVLTNDTAAITGFAANDGIYYIATADGSFAGISFQTGDWLISNGSAWRKIVNTDAVTGVKGNAEANYRIGNVNITAANVGAAATSSDAGDADKLIKADGTYVVANTANIADSAITTGKIGDNAVATAKIADSAVTTAKINDRAVTTEKINDGAVTSAKIEMSSLNFGNYSTTEKDTGFTWIDGRHIYKKTIHFGAGPNAGEKTVAHGISDLDNIINFEGFGKRNGPNYFPIQFTNTTAANQIYMFANSTNIILGSGIDRSSVDCYVTLYYVKTS